MRLVENNKKFMEFMKMVELLNDMDNIELENMFNNLDEKIKYKIKHTILHSRSFNVVAKDFVKNYDNLIDNELEFYKFHDMDKVICYLCMNKVDKSYHKELAIHHNLDLNNVKSVKDIENDYLYFENIIDFECSILSKPERIDNAYGIVKRQYKGNDKLLSIISELGFGEKYNYEIMELDVHNNNINNMKNDEIIKMIRESVEYLCK